jgi:hypothetical protein
MTALLGIDCATNPKKTGLALGEERGGGIHILRCTTGSKSTPPAMISSEWLKEYEDVLIALDAPLGWPKSLGLSLSEHKAGMPVKAVPDKLFSRATDRAIRERLGKRPLEVGANLIARTAVAALALIDELRMSTGRQIPLAWAPVERERWRAIEVYPSATRISHGAPDVGGSLKGFEGLVDYSSVSLIVEKSKDAADAVVCVLAASDFLNGRAIVPRDKKLASSEGWIWSRNKNIGVKSSFLTHIAQ